MANLWTVTIDDSSDGKREQHLVAGCFIGRKQDWNPFNKEWRKALKESPPLAYYQGRKLKALGGPFSQFRDKSKYPQEQDGWDAAYAKRDKLAAVIANSTLVGFGIGLRIPLYYNIRETHPRGMFFMAEDPFNYILQALIYEIARTIQGIDPKGKVAFVSDLSNKADQYTATYTQWVDANPETAKSMIGISHLDDTQHYGLQAADMAAGVVKETYDKHSTSNPVTQGFRLGNRFWRIAEIDERYMLEMLNHATSMQRRTLPQGAASALAAHDARPQ